MSENKWFCQSDVLNLDEIPYPITVSSFHIEPNPMKDYGIHSKVGSLAIVSRNESKGRPIYYLGLLLGYLPIGYIMFYDSANQALNLNYQDHPSLFIFETGKIIHGTQCCWHPVSEDKDLKVLSNQQRTLARALIAAHPDFLYNAKKPKRARRFLRHKRSAI